MVGNAGDLTECIYCMIQLARHLLEEPSSLYAGP